MAAQEKKAALGLKIVKKNWGYGGGAWPLP